MSQNRHYVGLSIKQVEESRAKHGENTLTPPKKRAAWWLLLDKFRDPIVVILLVALTMSMLVAYYQYSLNLANIYVFLEPMGILVSILLATLVGFLFELSANRKFNLLNRVNDDVQVKVVRDGCIFEVARREIVVGDIILLGSGDEVPADCRLLEAMSLQVNESSLTGEPVVRKSADEQQLSAESTYPSNYIMRGTTIVEGSCVARVYTVGDATEYGKVYEGSHIDSGVETPLNIQLNRLAGLITKVSYGIAILIIAGRLFSYLHLCEGALNWLDFGGYILNTVMIAVTIIVVAVPEGLPMSVTLSLALSMKRMLSANNLVRKMHACETMGATTVICTDKTGTLTCNQMRVYEAGFYGLEGGRISNNEVSGLLVEGIAMNSTAHLDRLSLDGAIKVLGNPTEGALLLWLDQLGCDYLDIRERHTIVEQLPFSTERKYMATIVESTLMGRRVLYVKGAPEILLSMSKSVRQESGVVSREECEAAIMEQLLGYQNQAMRTLGFAYQVIEEGDEREYITDGVLSGVDLIYLGVAAISDPIRDEVPASIKECQSAGIDVKIVTGDTSATAKQIGRQIGLWGDDESELSHITGAEFAAMSDEALLGRVMQIKIMSRARPMDKQRLVQLLQRLGQVVAVTGDGTNDAPALKAAQVGLSMGDGTSVAREASDITILDNSFGSIERAVMWGRSLYQNIQRFILFQLTINVVACLIVLIGALLGTESPLTVTQMLWVNLIMDTFAALALASLPPNRGVMKMQPRCGGEHIITKGMAYNILSVGLLFVALLFGLLQYFKHVDITSLSEFSIEAFFGNIFNFAQVPNGLTAYELSLFFTIFVMLQFWNMFNAKAFMTGRSALSNLAESEGFISTALLILIGQLVIVTFGGAMFNVVPLAFGDWLTIALTTSLVFVFGEVVRLIMAFRR